MKRFDVAIVGAGHAGAQAAIQLRQLAFAGSIGLIGAEAELPYERPPLSKDYLAGEKPFERMLLRPEGFWRERGVELVSGPRIVEVDAGTKVLRSDTGERFGYATLVWAAGGVPRRLVCEGSDRAHVVRCRADVDAIRARLPEVERALIVGGGYIGLEAAAVLRTIGKQVTLIEAEGRVLSRVAGEEISRFYEAEHRARGVELRLGATAERIGETELAIAAIGIDAAWEPLRVAGAGGANGVDVDGLCRTSLPEVYAVGDCAAHENRFAGGRRIRLESVQNAHDMATTAAKAIAGRPEPYDAIPWFWSNQYDLRLQTVGIAGGHDAAVVRGRPADRSFAVIYLREGRVIALDCVNANRDYVHGRSLVGGGTIADPERLADTAVPLKALAQ